MGVTVLVSEQVLDPLGHENSVNICISIWFTLWVVSVKCCKCECVKQWCVMQYEVHEFEIWMLMCLQGVIYLMCLQCVKCLCDWNDGDRGD